MTHAVHGLSKLAGTVGATVVPPPQRRIGTRLVLPLAVIGAAAGLLLYTARDVWLPAVAVRALPVVLKSVDATAAAGSVAVQAPGWLEPDPHPVFVTALTLGTVAEVIALEGHVVKAGDVVARLVDIDARLGRDRALAEARDRRAALAAATAERAAAKLAIAELIERTAARDASGAALAEVAAEAAKLEAVIVAAGARVAATRDEFERKSKLVEARAVSPGEVERLRLRVVAEAADQTAAAAGRPVLAAKQRAAQAVALAAARAFELRIEETRNAALAEAAVERAHAAVALAEVALAEAELALARTEIKASSDGVVLRRLVSPGSPLMREGEHPLHVVHLYDPRKLQVRVEVPLADASLVGVGQRAEVIVEALPERRFVARVTRLVHEADIARNTVQVKVALDDPDPLLKPEMLARVRFFGSASVASTGTTAAATGSARQRVMAPRAGVRRNAETASAWVVVDLSAGRGRAASRTLELAPGADGEGDWVEVRAGLLAGDLVIVDPPAGLAAGSRVRVTEAP